MRRRASPTQVVLSQHVPKRDGKLCHHWSVYGVTCYGYDLMLWRAAGKCEICGVLASTLWRGMLCVDHDHRLGNGQDHIRGMLCQKCNTALRYVDNGFRLPTQAQRQYIYNSWFWEWLPPDRLDEPYLPPHPGPLRGDRSYNYWKSPYYRRHWPNMNQRDKKRYPAPPPPQVKRGREAVLRWPTID